MRWIYDLREWHIRRAVALALLAGFLWLNSGYTINGFYHVVLSARASFYDTVDGELAAAIGVSTLPFGRTVSALLLVFVIWLAVDRVLKWIDFDGRFVDNHVDQLRADNNKLIESLQASNGQLEALYATIEKISDNNALLCKHQDRIVEIRIELEKLSLKSKNKPVEVAKLDETAAPDLFQQPKHPLTTNGRRPPRLQIPAPKF